MNQLMVTGTTRHPYRHQLAYSHFYIVLTCTTLRKERREQSYPYFILNGSICQHRGPFSWNRGRRKPPLSLLLISLPSQCMLRWERGYYFGMYKQNWDPTLFPLAGLHITTALPLKIFLRNSLWFCLTGPYSGSLMCWLINLIVKYISANFKEITSASSIEPMILSFDHC